MTTHKQNSKFRHCLWLVPFAALLAPGLCGSAAASTIAYLEEFTYATGGGGYTVHNLSSRAAASWKAGVPGEIGQCPSRSPRTPTYGWPYSWGTAQNPVGGYNTITGSHYRYENSYVMSPRIDLSGYAGSTPILSWTHFLRVASSNYGYVEVSRDDGFSWSQVYLGFGHATSTWVDQPPVVLSDDFATANFRIRFRMYGYYASSATTYAQEYGFYFDNVQVEIPDQNLPATVQATIGDGEMLDWPAGGVTTDTSVTADMPDGGQVTLTFAAGTQMQMNGSDFSGLFQGPYYYGDWYDAYEYGFPNYDDVDEVCGYLIGDEYESMALSQPLRILITGKGGRRVGWSDLDSFHPIATELPADDGSLLATLGVQDAYLYKDGNADGVIDENDDLIIWTNHLTHFVTYIPEPATAAVLLLGAVVLGVRRR